MAQVELEDVQIAYEDHIAVDGVSLSLEVGEVHVLLGQSGSGKSTILRALAGFERVRKGELRIGGRTVDGDVFAAPEDRPVGLVFQDYALFPHMSVGQNVAFGVGRGAPIIDELLELIGLAHRRDAMPGELSGGEQQRVALARALAREPEVLLFDEPFSNLDPELRADLRRQTFELVRDRGLTTLLVTHSAEEAMDVADRISVLRSGKLLQTGMARTLYQQPSTIEVASGLGPANVLEAEVSAGVVRCALGEVELGRVSGDPRGEGILVIRPEDIVVARGSGAVRIVRERFLGDRVFREIAVGGRVLMSSRPAWEPDAQDRAIQVRRAHWIPLNRGA
ncbi:ABC transporter ATP-binding protein [Bradymonas sediminis]|uniref:ABC transporter ATP-binding protein n=1 Tax=Bradymonas sediminis TaxID=1548548 RepID=A0A2Z4FI53_9DELT|nr:ABC transporter ATP-binding protein [Bradymonas sediminis]AWV88687.1 ABC transporter ATP-binding protein [Bradymonas sediminis]TDP63625.1 iron(III) transport system ATP-binding protein [Bradymonas sediminis]